MAHESKTLLASAARTATHNTDPQTNLLHRGLHLIVNVTAFSATPSLVVTIQGQGPASGTWYNLLVGTAITDVTIGTPPAAYVYKVYPGIATVSGGAASDVLPHAWRVLFTHGDADSITYSAGVNLLP